MNTLLKRLPWYQCPDSRAYHPEITITKNHSIWCGGYPFRIVNNLVCGFEADIEESSRANLTIRLDRKQFLKCWFRKSGLVCEVHNYGHPYTCTFHKYGWQDIKDHVAWLNRFRTG